MSRRDDDEDSLREIGLATRPGRRAGPRGDQAPDRGSGKRPGAPRRSEAADSPGDVPRIGRGRLGFTLPARQLFRIVMTIVTLIAVLALRKPCAQGVSNFFKNYEAPAVPDAGARRYIRLPPPPPTPTPSTPSR